MGLNAARALRKPRIRSGWERKFRDLHQVLFLYAVVREFIALVIEGDEAYTKVQKNVPRISHLDGPYCLWIGPVDSSGS